MSIERTGVPIAGRHLSASWSWSVYAPDGPGTSANAAAANSTGTWIDDQTLQIEITATDAARVIATWNPSSLAPDSRPLNLTIQAACSELTVEIEPSQFHAVIGNLRIESSAREVTVSSPIWADRTEMGTAEIHHLRVSPVDTLFLGGDELWVRSLQMSYGMPVGRPKNPPGLTILANSRLFLGMHGSWINWLNLGTRSFVELDGQCGFSIGKVGVDAEIAVVNGIGYIEDWTVEECSGDERLQLIGVGSFDYLLQRRVTKALSERGAGILATYAPADADRLPPDITMSIGAKRDWVRTQEALIERYCDDPAVTADARWLSYEIRRVAAPRLSTTRIALTIMKALGYGQKVGPPLITWMAATTMVVGIWAVAGNHDALRPTQSGVW